MSKIRNSLAALSLAAAGLISNTGAQAQSTGQIDATKGAVNMGLSQPKGTLNSKQTAVSALQEMSKMDITTSDGTVIRGGVEFRNTGAIAQGEVGKEIFSNAAVVVKVEAGSKHRGFLTSLGFKISENNYLVLSHQELSELLKFQFTTQTQEGWLSQVTDAAVWTWVNPNMESRLQYGKVSIYQTESQSKSFGNEKLTMETSSMYELFQKEMRVAGQKNQGAEASFGIAIDLKTTLSLGAGVQNMRDKTFLDRGSKTTGTAQIGLKRDLADGKILSLGISGSGNETRYTVGFDKKAENGLSYGVQAFKSAGKNGQVDTAGIQFRVSGNMNIDGFNPSGSVATKTPIKYAAASPDKNPSVIVPVSENEKSLPSYYQVLSNGKYAVSANEYAAAGGVMPQMIASNDDAPAVQLRAAYTTNLPISKPKNLLDATFQAGNATYIPKQVYASVDTTVTPVRLISIDKTLLPAGSMIDTVTGDVTIPVVLALGNFKSATNTTNGRNISVDSFDILGNSLRIRTASLQSSLSPGVNSITVVTTAATITILAKLGSVEIQSITVTPNAPTATIDDVANKIVLPAGTDLGLYEVNDSVGGLGWVPLTASATF